MEVYSAPKISFSICPAAFFQSTLPLSNFRVIDKLLEFALGLLSTTQKHISPYNGIVNQKGNPMTTIYLIRHSKPLKVSHDFDDDNLQIQNEKTSLSIEGEKLAATKLSQAEFANLDALFSSSYVRAIQTAKYLAAKNDGLEIKVVSDLGERKFGVATWDELPDDFEHRQFLDENYKIGDGESQKEVRSRIYAAFLRILRDHPNQRVAIVSHAQALSCLLSAWCDIEIADHKPSYSLNGKVLLSGRHFNYCETFKLEFDGDNLIDIENLTI